MVVVGAGNTVVKRIDDDDEHDDVGNVEPENDRALCDAFCRSLIENCSFFFLVPLLNFADEKVDIAYITLDC